MQDLINTYKQKGEFTHEQKCNYFVSPSNEILDMIINSDDFNFRKTCLMTILDFNPVTELKQWSVMSQFFKHKQVKSVLRDIIMKDKEREE